jgi:putative transposase
MAEGQRMTAEEVVAKLMSDEHADLLRESLRWMVEQLMEVEVSALIGAERGERTPDRATHRNGYRARRWDTRAGELELQIPKLRRGSYFPSFLEPRRRSEQALLNVVQQAYVTGVSTRKVDQLVESLGLRISRSEVSRIAQGLDEQVEAFRQRPLEGRYPYLWLDAKVEKVRDGGRVRRKCLVIAHGGHDTGRREVIALDVGEAETEAFWREFLRGLVKRGLVGGAAGDLGRPSRPQGGDRPGARLPLAALHGALPQGLPRPRPARRSWFPRVEELTVEGVGHLLHAQRPEPVARGIAEFLGRHPITVD